MMSLFVFVLKGGWRYRTRSNWSLPGTQFPLGTDGGALKAVGVGVGIEVPDQDTLMPRFDHAVMVYIGRKREGELETREAVGKPGARVQALGRRVLPA